MSDQTPRAERAPHDHEAVRPRPRYIPPRRRPEIDDDHDERFGLAVCATGICDEPCGQHGGCVR